MKTLEIINLFIPPKSSEMSLFEVLKRDNWNIVQRSVKGFARISTTCLGQRPGISWFKARVKHLRTLGHCLRSVWSFYYAFRWEKQIRVFVNWRRNIHENFHLQRFWPWIWGSLMLIQILLLYFSALCLSRNTL